MIISLISGLLQDIDSRLRNIECRLESQHTAASATADICNDEMFNEPLHTAAYIIELNKELKKGQANRVCKHLKLFGIMTVTQHFPRGVHLLGKRSV